MRIIKIIRWIVPLFHNSHSEPYGTIMVEYNGIRKTVKFSNGGFTAFRKKYKIFNVGSLYNPTLKIKA